MFRIAGLFLSVIGIVLILIHSYSSLPEHCLLTTQPCFFGGNWVSPEEGISNFIFKRQISCFTYLLRVTAIFTKNNKLEKSRWHYRRTRGRRIEASWVFWWLLREKSLRQIASRWRTIPCRCRKFSGFLSKHGFEFVWLHGSTSQKKHWTPVTMQANRACKANTTSFASTGIWPLGWSSI